MKVDRIAKKRVDTLLELGVLFNIIHYGESKSSDNTLRQLEGYKKPLRAMQDGGDFDGIAGKYLEVIDCMQAYVRTGAANLNEIAHAKYHEAQAMVEALGKRLRENGV